MLSGAVSNVFQGNPRQMICAYRNPKPPDEAVVSLKGVVVVANGHQNSVTSKLGTVE